MSVGNQCSLLQIVLLLLDLPITFITLIEILIAVICFFSLWVFI